MTPSTIAASAEERTNTVRALANGNSGAARDALELLALAEGGKLGVASKRLIFQCRLFSMTP